jgi:SPOR domain/PilZ domain
MIEERRQHPRLVPSAPLFVSLDDSKSGLVLDVCEGGVAVASLVPRSLDQIISLSFDLPRGSGHIRAKAAITWTRDSGHITGARFVDLDETCRQQLEQWISSRTNAAAQSDIAVTDAPDSAPGQGLPVEAEAEVLLDESIEPVQVAKDAPAQEALFSERMPSASVAHEEPTEERQPASSTVNETPLATEEQPSEDEPFDEILVEEVAAEEQGRSEENTDRELTTEVPVHAEAADPTMQAETPHDEAAEPVFVTRSTYTQVEPSVPDRGDQVANRLRASVLSMQHAHDGGLDHDTKAEDGWAWFVRERHPVELFLAVVLLSWALVFLGYQMGSTHASRQSREATAATKREPPIKASVASVDAALAGPPLVPAVTPAVTSPAGPGLGLGDSGVVLQVGAMKLEDNADALAQELQKKKFPAFVFRHGNDRLYHVAIGPYTDSGSTTHVKSELEKQGLQPILRRWLPD